ncbi:MAG: zinc-ribbon domain-containing protein [Methanobacteriota archaeon]
MNKKKTIEDMRTYAANHDGKCLSERYIDMHSKLKWQCKCGHEWSAVPSSLVQGHWCPICRNINNANRSRLKIEDIQKLAKDRGGEFLSLVYTRSGNRYKWKCSKGHEWSASVNSVKDQGSWCPRCAGKARTDIIDLRTIAAERSGTCLSKKCGDAFLKLLWRCKKGHTFYMAPHSVKRGQWCPTCAIERNTDRQRLRIKDIQDLAKARGGLLLSSKYSSNRTPLKWQCSEGHSWVNIVSNIKKGQWCPVCKTGVSEKICREIFQRLFKKEFPRIKPSWLINPKTGNKMELDGYCKELGIAFEYSGVQHYKTKKFFDQKESLIERQMRDQVKRELCVKHNIALIEVPYDIEFDKMAEFIINQCKNRDLKFTINNLDIYNYKSFNIYKPNKINEMRQIASERGGTCLSKVYINSHTALDWKCKEGHIWSAMPIHVKRRSWCPYCVGRHKTIEDMREYAKNKGGDCLSEKYIKSNVKLKWKCKDGHIWEAPPASIFMGHWCPYCVGYGKTIEDMNKLASVKNGICQSQAYINSSTKLKWKCSEGHEWLAVPTSIAKGHWCHICSRKKVIDAQRPSIEDMEKLAILKGGKCISPKYFNSSTKLKWRCKEGHIFLARPSTVRQGHWCPFCVGRGKTIDHMQRIAENCGGMCLSKRYVNSKTKLKWRCGFGHEWENTPGHIQRGQWCPICAQSKKGASQRLNIELMKEIAQKRGGRCVSDKYLNNNTKIKWMCNKGHTWEARPSSIKNNGTWCPVCARIKATKK